MASLLQISANTIIYRSRLLFFLCGDCLCGAAEEVMVCDLLFFRPRCIAVELEPILQHDTSHGMLCVPLGPLENAHGRW